MTSELEMAGGIIKASMAPDNSLQARLLGVPEFSYKGERVAPSSRKAQALLCYLAARNQSVEREHLAELLWGAGKLNNVRQALYELRQLVGADAWLDDDSETVRVRAHSDLAQAEAAFEQSDFAEVTDHYRADFLASVKVNAPAFNDWLELERSRLNQLRSEARAACLDIFEANGHHAEALDIANDLLSEDSLNETAHRAVMRLEYAQGNVEAALEQFETCRLKLKEELGVEPLPETLALLAEIEQGGAGTGKSAQVLTVPDDILALPETLVGREGLIETVQSHLDEHARVLVHGFGGIGKTALAASLGETYLKKGKVLWLELGQADPSSALDALVRPFEAQQELAKAEDKAEFLESLLSEQSISLLVLDDVWNAYSLSVLLETLPSTLPLLITSRQRYPRLKRVDVGRLERLAALDLLSFHAGRDLSSDSAADALCEHLGDHAYALRVAGINLRESETSPQTLLDNIKDTPHDLRIPEDLSAQDRGSVASLLQVSMEPLDDYAFEAFLAYGALFAPSATPELLAQLLRRDSELIEDALFTLVTRGLAERSATPGSDTVTYRVHDLSHAYVKAINNHRSKSVIGAAKSYLETHPNEPDVLEAELPNILGATERADDETLVAMMRLLTLDGTYFMARGHNNRSLRLLDRAIRLAKALGELATAHEFLGKQGDTYINYLGQLEKALVSYEKALLLAQKVGNRGREAVYLSILGVLKFRQKQPDAANYLDKAYQLAKQYADAFDLCTVLGHNGYVAGIKQDYERVIGFSQETLDIVNDLVNRKTFDQAEVSRKRFFSLNNMAQALHFLGRYEASLEKRREALSLADEQDNQIWSADALYGLGETYHATTQRENAEKVLSDALALYKKNQANVYAQELEAFMNAEGYTPRL